jgi:hypothetical protein
MTELIAYDRKEVGMGRRPDGSEARTELVQTRITPKAREAIDSVREKDEDLSQFVRKALSTEVSRRKNPRGAQ